MTYWQFVTFLLLIQVNIFLCHAQEETDFVSLFNGKDLSGWQIEKEGSFSVRDGVIVMDGRGGWLRTDKQFQDFELHLEFRFMEPGADTGIYFRYGDGERYQIQTRIQDRWGEVRARKAEVEQTRNVEYVKSLVKKNKTQPKAWHRYAIVVRGEQATVKLDGEIVSQAKGLEIHPGFIGLQGERPTIEYRNIQLRDLKPNSK